MKNIPSLGSAHRTKTVTIFALPACLSVFSSRAAAQGVEGQNDVYSSTFGQVGSSAFIDASVFQGHGQGADLCDTIYQILTGGFKNTYPAAGAVIDARGISGAALTCTLGSPWLESGGSYANFPSTILLPAGIILIQTKWTLPDGTKIIGEGTGGVEVNGSITLVSATTIQACNTGMNSSCTKNFVDTVMIQMGGTNCTGSNSTCHSVGIEDLSLDGQGASITGISNSNSVELSYVNRVNLYRLGLGLSITGLAQNSGPYSNIIFDTGGSANTGQCVEIGLTAGGTRGIRGLTCIASSDSTVAISLDSSYNSLEDIRIAGFYDGIRVGSNSTSNVLRNIYGDTEIPLSINTPPVNVVHIEQGATNTVIMGLSNAGSGTVTIQDDNLNKTLPSIYDQTVGLYAIGSVDNNSGGYSRLTTSPSANTWAAGYGDLTPNTTCSVPGSIYSNATAGQTGGGSYGLWVCAGRGSWQSVK